MRRRGGGFIVFLLVVVAVAAGGFLIWGYIANEREFAPGDAEWRERTLDHMKQTMKKAKEETWGDGGLVDQAGDKIEQWREEDDEDGGAQAGGETGDGSAPEEEPESIPEPVVGKSPATLEHEAGIAAAEEHFREGHASYLDADPAMGNDPADSLDAILEAHERFGKARKLLLEHLGPYEARDDHDPEVLARAKELRKLNRRYLENSERLLDG